MRYLQFASDGVTVDNIVQLPTPGLTTWGGFTVTPEPGPPGSVPIGYVLDPKTGTYTKKPVDQAALAAAKTAAMSHVDALNATLQSIADGSLKAQISAATDPAAVKTMQASADVAIASSVSLAKG